MMKNILIGALVGVLNLIITGIPSIHKREKLYKNLKL